MTEMNKFEAAINGEPEKRVGEQVGSYRLIRWLGRGTFADVYLGEHIYLGTQSAIKMLHVHLPEKAVKDFLNEARIIARLDHPNIVRVFDYGVENGTPFLVMAYAPNGSLRQRFPERMCVSLERIVPLVQQVASALDYAHQQKLIHRDVKPENMLLGPQNQVLLSDFGFVLVAQDTHSQAANAMVGTALYMAPEMVEGKVHFASDQYALGIVTYQWLCGEYPFTGSYFQVGAQHMFVPPSSLCEKVPDLPPSVERVVFKALAKDRAQRYENVTAFASALQDACKDTSSIDANALALQLSSSSSETLTVSGPIKSRQPSRHPGTIRGIVLLVVAIIAVIGSSVRLWDNMTSSRVSTHSTASTTIKGISVTYPTVPASPITTVHLTPQIIATSTPQIIATPTPKAAPQIIATPTPVVVHIRTIDDSVQGTGPNQFSYVGNWRHCTGGCSGCCYDGTWSWDNATGDYMTLSFTGIQIKFYGVIGPYGGFGGISIDGGSETMVNCYSTEAIGNQLMWTSPMLPAGNHTFKLRATGTKGDPSSQDSEAAFDRVDILS